MCVRLAKTLTFWIVETALTAALLETVRHALGLLFANSVFKMIPTIWMKTNIAGHAIIKQVIVQNVLLQSVINANQIFFTLILVYVIAVIWIVIAQLVLVLINVLTVRQMSLIGIALGQISQGHAFPAKLCPFFANNVPVL